MKISLDWIKDYIEIQESPLKLAEILTNTGLEVEGLHEFEPVEGSLKGMVIGEVLTCEKHPNADKLKITTVDIGLEQPSPIVCGAPNVATGQKVVVATVGSTLYPVGHEPFKIKKAKIRGEVSEGMICAEDEIGMGNSHDGIMVLGTDLPNGTPAADFFKIQPDQIFEIGLTPNRADAASHIGTARDLKAVLNRPITWPNVDEFEVDNLQRSINVKVENVSACPRYSGITISGVSVEESPDWLKKRLKAVGLSPINNIVDITNFVMMEVGQPLHAFDADEIKGDTVLVKTLPTGSTFTTLDEKERKLGPNDLMICNGESEGMCIAGVFGGIHSGIKSSTKNIFLESAYFNPDFIRKTAARHQLKTDASFRYERGTDPRMTVYALKRATLLIKELAGGAISSDIVDIYPSEIQNFEVEVYFKNINRLLGIALDPAKIFHILESLDIEIKNKTKESFVASVPPYRVDVQREADIAEEILRIYGLNNIHLPGSFNSDFLAEFPSKDVNKLQKSVSDMLASNGFYEILTNSLTKPSYAENASDLDEQRSIGILNKLSEELGVLRQSLLYSGLEVLAYNINRKQADLRLYEFGKNYVKDKDGYTEKNRLAIYLTGSFEPENWNSQKRKVTFHDLSATIKLIIDRLIDLKLETTVIHQYPYDFALKAIHKGKVMVTYGKLNNSVLQEIGIKQDVFYADVDWDLLLMNTNNNIVYREVSKFPEVRRDLSLVIDKSITFEDIKAIAKKSDRQLLRSLQVFDVYEGESIGTDKKAYAISFILQDQGKTLTDKVIDRVMSKMMSSFETELGALIRK